MQSQPIEIRDELRSLLEHLSDSSPQMRMAAAQHIGEFSQFISSSEKPILLLQLKNMILNGTEQSDFRFGLDALGKVASGPMPTHVTSNIPFTKKDAVGIVFEACTLDWVSEKLDQDRIINSGVKAITSIAGDEPLQVQCKLLEMLSRKSETARMLALTSIFVLDLNTPEAIRKVASSTMDANSNVRLRAEETFRKISRFGHPIRNMVLCSTPREARNAAEILLNQKSPDTHSLKALAVVSFLRGTEKGNELINLMLERNLLRETDIEKHEKEAREGCSTSEMEAMLGRRKRQLRSKLFAIQQGPSLGRDSVPSVGWRQGRFHEPSKPPHSHKRRSSIPPMPGTLGATPGKLLN